MKLNAGLIFSIIASILWGMEYSIAERIYKQVSIYTASFYICIVGTILSFILGYHDLKPDTTKIMETKDLSFWFIMFIVVGSIASLCISKSVQLSNATVAALIEISYPMFTILFSYWLFKSVHVTKEVIFGSVLIILGIAVITKYN